MVIDRTTEADLSTLFDTDFIRSLTQYLGMDPDTPSEDMPLSITELLEEAISSCEQEQWRFILPKDVTIFLPISAFTCYDNALILPLGPSEEDIALTYTDSSNEEQSFDSFTTYHGEPIRLWSEDWSTITDNCNDTPYPITVSYRPGYTSYSQIPKSTIRALKILVSHSFEFRGIDAPIPKAYEHNRNLAWLNNERANKYIIDDWSRVYPR